MKSILSRKPKTSNPPANSSSEPAAIPPKFTPRGTGSKQRIMIAVKDGVIDFKAMQSEAAKELNDLMHKPEVQKQFGIGPLTEGFNPAHCKRLWQAAGNVLWGMGKLVAKMPEEACDVLRFTDEEQEELAKPTASVLDELAPTWLRENQALAALIIVAGSVIQNKFREAQAITIAVQKAKASGTYIRPESRRASRVPIVMPSPATEPREPVNGATIPPAEVVTAPSGIGPEISGAAPRM